MIRVRLLGPVTIELDDQPLDIRRPMELALMARLALEPGRSVATERLVDDLWGERLPREPKASLQSLVYRLRQNLSADDGVVHRTPTGYALDVQPDHVDSSQFNSLLTRARRTEPKNAGDRRAVLHEALQLWRGPALAGLEAPFATFQRPQLETARLVALKEKIDADLECGAHREVVAELEGLVREQPDDERLWAQLIVALYRSGSQAAALRACDKLRTHLRDALGMNPSSEIRDLEQAILVQDPALASPSSSRSPGRDGDQSAGRDGGRNPLPRGVSGDTGGRPRDTPAAHPSVGDALSPPDRAVADLIRAARRTASNGHRRRRSAFLPLVGRQQQLETLQRVLAGMDPEGGSAFALVRGSAGCGKTRLLDELADRARAWGKLVVATSAEDDDVLPYRPFADLVCEVLASPFAAACLEELGPLVTDLAWLVPKAPGNRGLPAGDVGLARMRLFESVVGLTELAAGHQELVFLMDDAHRMGTEGAALMSLLLDRVRSADLAVVLAARPDTESGGRGFPDLLRRHEPVRVDVGPLTASEVEGLASHWARDSHAPATPIEGATLHARTGGIPLLVAAVLSGQSEGYDRVERVEIDDLVIARTRMLSPGVREMLQVAALMGTDVNSKLIANVTGGDSRMVRHALDRVVDGGGLIDGNPSNDEYSWRHSLIRQAVIDSVPPPDLRRFREAVGGAWSDQGESLRAARQAVEVLEMSTGRLLPVVLAGIDEALRALAFELAEDLSRRALDVVGRSGSPVVQVQILNRLGRCLAFGARRDEATDAWENAAEIARRASRPDLIAEVALATEPFARSAAPYRLRWSLLNEVVPVLATFEVPTQVRIIAAWIDEGTLPVHAVTDPALCDQALVLARQEQDDSLLALALAAAHNARRSTREVPVDVSAEFCHVADRIGSPAWRSQAHLAGLIDAVSGADKDQADAHLDAYLQAVDASPSPRSRWEASMVRSTWALLNGDGEVSDLHASIAVETGQRYGIEDAALAFAIHLFFRSFHQGTLDGLREPLTRFAGEHPEIPAWLVGAGLANVAAGDIRAAAAMRDRVLPHLLVPRVDPTWPVAACLAAQLCHDTGAGGDQTEPLLEMLRRYPGRVAVLGRFIGDCGPVERYLGLLARDEGRSRRWFTSAIAQSEQFGATLWAQRARADLENCQ